MGRINREEIHGDPPGYKLEGLAALLFESFGGMAQWKPIKEKIVQRRKFARRIDMYCG